MPGPKWQGKHKRMAWLGLGALVVSAAAVLAITALEQNITFFYSPADLSAADLPVGRDFRLGGMVADNSIEREPGGLVVHFVVTDYEATTPVTYRGILPDLFREGQGVVAIGSLDAEGRFQSDEILAKHDENYMPPEVAAALERNRPKGQLQSTGTLQP
ncbi:MAG: cytochrome c maturation protein CcmE [Alphaproteobacteria bacterium]|nr:cytochrome c maturation protein CcmE [Alphaproteobacteria bacterium SS10]